MTLKRTTALALVSALLATVAQAEDFKPEVLTVEASIPEGPNALVIDFALNGSSNVFVLDAETLKLKGNIGTGTAANMTMNAAGDTLYTAGIYMERYLRGTAHPILEEWDLKSLKLRREIELPMGKLAQAETQPSLMQLSPDEKLLLIQNAAPAQSVSVINLESGEAVAEIPSPGCWTINPALEGQRFSMLCGDGKIASVSYEADGSFSDFARSETIFDPAADPLISNPIRVGDKLVWVSYGGVLHFVDDSGETPVLAETKSLLGDVEGWAPGGSEVIAYHAASNTAFVLMHSNPFDGSHKNPAEEIWMIDMADVSLKGRFPAHGEGTISVSQDETPTLFGANHEGSVTRYDVTLGETPDIAFAGERPGVGFFLTMISLDH